MIFFSEKNILKTLRSVGLRPPSLRLLITILSSDISLDTHGIDVMVQPRVAVVLEVLISVMSLSLVMYESR